MSTAEVRELALHLSAKDRAALARQLIESLDPLEADPGVDEAWTEEIEGRAEAVDRGEAQLFEGPSALEEIRREIREGH